MSMPVDACRCLSMPVDAVTFDVQRDTIDGRSPPHATPWQGLWAGRLLRTPPLSPGVLASGRGDWPTGRDALRCAPQGPAYDRFPAARMDGWVGAAPSPPAVSRAVVLPVSPTETACPPHAGCEHPLDW